MNRADEVRTTQFWSGPEPESDPVSPNGTLLSWKLPRDPACSRIPSEDRSEDRDIASVVIDPSGVGAVCGEIFSAQTVMSATIDSADERSTAPPEASPASEAPAERVLSESGLPDPEDDITESVPAISSPSLEMLSTRAKIAAIGAASALIAFAVVLSLGGESDEARPSTKTPSAISPQVTAIEERVSKLAVDVHRLANERATVERSEGRAAAKATPLRRAARRRSHRSTAAKRRLSKRPKRHRSKRRAKRRRVRVRYDRTRNVVEVLLPPARASARVLVKRSTSK